jgi:hypothetical protein
MDRKETIKAIRDLVGGKMVFDEKWIMSGVNPRLVIGDDRPVCAISKKFVYMDSQCYVKAIWEDDDTLVNAVCRIPMFVPLYGKITGKVELDTLCSKDLESIYNGIVEYFNWQMNRIPELQKQLEVCMKFQTKYNKMMKK